MCKVWHYGHEPGDGVFIRLAIERGLQVEVEPRGVLQNIGQPLKCGLSKRELPRGEIVLMSKKLRLELIKRKVFVCAGKRAQESKPDMFEVLAELRRLNLRRRVKTADRPRTLNGRQWLYASSRFRAQLPV